MVRVRKRINIEELPNGLEDGTGVLGSLLTGDEFLFFDTKHIDCAEDADSKEGQLIGAVGTVLIQNLQNAAVGKGAERVQQTVDDGMAMAIQLLA